MDSPAIFKGTKEGILIFLNPDYKFEEVLHYLEQVLNERKVFFSGSSLIIEPNNYNLIDENIERLTQLFKRFGIAFSIKGIGAISQKEEVTVNYGESGKTIVISHTLRAGQLIRFDGNIVVLGDINEGAEITISKSAYVFGVVRGIINAGESVISLGFMPMRMIIGKSIFNNENSGKTYRKPRIAKVENGKIVIKVLGEKKSIRR